MKILVAGASGAIGKMLVPMLVHEGHEVIGVTRKDHLAAELRNMGARPVVLNVFDREAVFSALRIEKPDTVIHQLTSLGARDFAEHARIRREGTRNLVDASLEAGVNKMIAQSISWAYEAGIGPATEEDALDLEAPLPRKTTVESVHALESAVAEMPAHVILRYGQFYGPGTWYAPGNFIAEQVRQQQLPITRGVSSFIHVEDAARAAVLALQWPSGHYNITDNEPASGTEWLPVYAGILGAPVPSAQTGGEGWERGALNRKALQHGWMPRFESWREGFRHRLG